MLQIRITNFDGTEPVILDRASSRSYAQAINSADGGVRFNIAKNDPKADVVNPYLLGYTKRWEVWDTDINRLLNYGPITSISDNPTEWGVTGAGRAALLNDFYKTLKTFYATVYNIIEDISYENLAAQPRTSTNVPDVTTSAAQTTVFGNTVVINERYHGLSKNSKDRAIDDDTGLFLPGDIEPSNTYYSNDSYWSGMSKADSHIVDLGGVYDLNRIVVTLPTWGGAQRLYNRTYDYEIAIATDEGSTTSLQDKEFGAFTTVYASDVPSMVVGGVTIYIGLDENDDLQTEADLEVSTPVLQNLRPVPVRYIRTKITNVHAWFGSHFDNDPSIDGWLRQCDPDYEVGDISGYTSPKVMLEDINDRVIEPANDCHASVNEIAANKRIVELNSVKPLALQRIDNNSLQIKYAFHPSAGETKTTSTGFRRFEPGSFFRKIGISFSGAFNNYTKFFSDDCDGCIPDGFSFGIMDQNNSLVYATDLSSATGDLKVGAYTKHVLMKGDSNAVITYCDAWKARLDPFSYGGSYSYNEIAGDTATIRFRGQSFKWYATVPANKTGANVNIHIKSEDDGSFTLLDNLTLPNDISNELVYEITYESGTLEADKTYEIRITNVNGNFCSIDSIEGYWSSSMVEYNEDSSRIFISNPMNFKQIYDKRFSGGSMYKMDSHSYAGISFTGDRVVVTSAKGRNHGKMRILLIDQSLAQGLYDPGTSNHVFIPGGDPSDGSLLVNLDTGKTGNEMTQAVIFDSDDYFGYLPWGRYGLGISLQSRDIETFTSNTADIETENFVARCKDCTEPEGEDITVNKPVFLDGIFVHELVGLSVSFDNETHLEILKSTAEAVQAEWLVDAGGITFEPRIGTDTEVYLREGENTLVNWGIENDLSQIATILLSYGADIDGLPLYTITENKETRARVGRTIMRQEDFRNVGDYFQLVGMSRTGLKRRSYPEKRITVSHVGNLSLEPGDSFILWTRKSGSIRVRIIRKEISESNGRVYNLECVTWPQII